MTVLLPAWLQSGAYTAEFDRMVPTGLLSPSSATGARGGVRRWSGNEFQALATTPATMQVTIKAGMAWVPGGYSPTQGAYVVMNDADVTLPIGSAPASLPRIDLVVLEVLDQSYAGSSNLAQLRVVAGTAAATPVPPPVIGNYIVLAQVRVNASVSSITTSAITDVRPFVGAVGGVLPVKNQTDRLALVGLPTGSEVLELDTGRVYQSGYGPGGWTYAYGGSPPMNWIFPPYQHGWHDYGEGFRPSRVRKTADGAVELQIMARAGTMGSSVIVLPVGYRPSLRAIFAGRTGEPNMACRWDVFPTGEVTLIIADHAYSTTNSNRWGSLSATFGPDQ